MHDLFASPGFWTAFMAMIGVLAGAFLTRLNSRDEMNVKKIVAQNEDDRQDFEALHTTVEILQSLHHPRLLKDNLRNPYPIRIGGFPPG